MVNRGVFFVLSGAMAVTGCGQQQPQQQTNPQFQTQNAPINQANPNIDCTPIANPNYVPGGNQAEYYYPQGCQPNANMNGYNGGSNNGYNNGSNIGGYVGAAAVGAAAGALANRAYNQRNQRNQNNATLTPKPTNNTPYTRPTNNKTYTPTYNQNSTVYRKGTINNRATARSSSRRR